MAKVSSSNTTTLYSTTQTTPILPGAAVPTGPVNTTNFTTLYSQTNGVPGGGASDDLLVKGNLRVLGTSDLEGRVTIGNSYSLPTADGTNGQIMTTDGNGNVSFEDATGLGKTYDISATTTTGGANFNLNSDVPTTDTIKFAQGTGISVTATSANEITIASTTPPGTTYDFNASSSTGGANLNLVGSDSTTDTVKLTDGGHITATYTSATAITLGSDATSANTANAIVSRDASGNFVAGQGAFDSGVKINGSTSGSSTFTAPATGSTLSYVLPGTAGAASTVLTNDGSGNLSWAAGGGGGTYTIDASTTTGGANFNLQNGGTDTIKFAEGSNISIIATSANEITISATGNTNIFGNLEVGASPDLNTIKSINTNGDIELQPNGTGDVQLTADTVRVGDANATATITTNGTGNMVLNTNSGTNSGNITINQGAGANIEINPNGTGDVQLNADTVQIGDANTQAILTTNGTGNLLLNTNNGTNSGTILINQGANTDIVITPNGTGDVDLVADTVVIGDANAAATLTTNGTGNLTLSTNNGTNSGTILINQGANTDIVITPNGTGDVDLVTDTVVIGDSNATATVTTNGTGDLVLNTNAGTNSGNITISQGINANIAITPNGAGDVQLNADTVRVGDANATATITTNGTGNLVLNTNNGTTSGSITINQGVNGAISIVPHSSTPGTTGDINLTSDKVVVGDGFGNGFITTTSNVSLILQGDNVSGGRISLGNFGVGGPISLKTSSTSSYINLESNATIFGRDETAGNPAYIGTSSRSGVIPTTYNDLIIQTGDPYFNTTAGKITMIASANGNITLVPNGTGRTSITNGTIANNLQFNGSTSGTVQFAAPAVAGTQAYTLPTALPGVSGYVLSSDTSGALSWIAGGGTSTFGNLSIGVVTPNTIASTDTDGPIILAPDGSGNVDLVVTGTGVINLSHGDPTGGSLVIVGDGTNDAAIASNGTTSLFLGSGADLTLAPSGDVFLETALIVAGTGAAASTITTNGAYDLVLGTNAATVGTSPLLTLTQAGGIALQATAATNAVSVVNSLFQHNMNSYTAGAGTAFLQAHTTADANNFSLIRARGTTVSPSAVQTGDELAEFSVAGHDGQTGITGYEQAWGFTTTVTATPTSNVMPTRTDFVINTAANTRTVYHSIEPDLIFRVVELGTVAGVTDLFISAGTDGNVEIAPNGTGELLVASAMQVFGDITSPLGSDADLTLVGDGIGNINLNSEIVRIGDVNTAATLTTNGTGNLVLNTNAGTNSGTITINQGVNGDIQINPNGTGEIDLVADNVIIGDVGSSANVTTNGTNLVLSTNNNVSSGRITISSGLNNDITIEPNGTGDIDLIADNIQIGDANTAVTLTTFGTGNLTLSTNNGTNSGTITIAQGADANISITPNGNGDVQLNADTVRVGDANAAATITSNGTGNLTLSTNNGTNSGTILINQGADGNIDITPNGGGDVNLNADIIRVGDANATAIIATNGTGNLILRTDTISAASGDITINHSANGNISITPNGTGQTIVKNLEYQEFVHSLGTTSGTITPNATNGNIQTITLNGNLTLNAFTSPISGQTITFVITQDGVGNRTLTSTMRFAGGSKTLSTAANAIDILTVSYIGTTYYASLAKGYV